MGCVMVFALLCQWGQNVAGILEPLEFIPTVGRDQAQQKDREQTREGAERGQSPTTNWFYYLGQSTQPP